MAHELSQTAPHVIAVTNRIDGVEAA